MDEVTFKEFAQLMVKRSRSVDDLVDLFRGKLEDSRNFFERVMSCRWRNPETGRYEDRSDVVIPYRSVLEFYLQELSYFESSKKQEQQLNEKRKRGPVSPERREALRKHLEKVRAMRKSGASTREIIEEVI
jgi:Arc/MetJ-type ribon-helix-helix transcriptional regulator